MGLVMQQAAQPAALQRRRSARNWGCHCHWLEQAGSSTHLLRYASKQSQSCGSRQTSSSSISTTKDLRRELVHDETSQRKVGGKKKLIRKILALIFLFTAILCDLTTNWLTLVASFSFVCGRGRGRLLRFVNIKEKTKHPIGW